jgi:hypothetical protein
MLDINVAGLKNPTSLNENNGNGVTITLEEISVNGSAIRSANISLHEIEWESNRVV